MCGFAGYYSEKKTVNESVCQKMVHQISHRGPDDHGVWIDRDAGIVLAHRRLSIQDLSTAGHQPMESRSGRYVITYNGEIYNFKKLQLELEKQGHCFRGHSDTEVLLASIEHWGIEAALKGFVGMFAFALWDKKERVLTLARDRLGEKPLYYGWQGESLLFASELKAMREHPEWKGETDRDVITLYLRYSYIPAPYSIYKNIHKLMPGDFIQFHHGLKRGEIPSPSHYWSAHQVAVQGASDPFDYSDSEAIDHLEQLLGDSVKEKMVADVPLGAFLSGGVDSSTVVALMQANSSRKVNTFSIGFNESEYNEAVFAKSVAKVLGTNHTELYISSSQAMDVVSRLPQLYDEPFADSSQIPTFLVSQMTRQSVSVALSGDGGDELFCGYDRYAFTDALWGKISKIPFPVRCAVASAIQWPTPGVLNASLGWLSPLAPKHYGRKGPMGDKLLKLAELLPVRDKYSLYRQMTSICKRPDLLVADAEEPEMSMAGAEQRVGKLTFRQHMMYIDMISYLPDSILCKVDRAAMAVSLETRVPMLDHRIVEFASKLPMSMKVRGGQEKWILRQVLYKYLPKELVDRPKMGFSIPVGDWLRGSLRDWSESLLDETRLRDEGFFNAIAVRKKWDEHMTGQRNVPYQLWNILMFQAWFEDHNQPLCRAAS